MSGGAWCGGGAVMAAAVCLSMTAAAANRSGDIQRSLIVEANRAEVPVSLALAVARVESGFNAGALSDKGARGVMQILPETAMGEFGVGADSLWDGETNVRLGVQYLKRLHSLYGGRWDLALSHYNGGTVKGDSPSSYTRDYVAAVQAWQDYYARRGCDRLTAKRIVTHADSVALCLQAEGGPVITASLSVEQPAAAPAAEPEPPLPAAAPQVPVQREGVAAALRAVKGAPPATKATTPAAEPTPAPTPAAAPAPTPSEPATRTAKAGDIAAPPASTTPRHRSSARPSVSATVAAGDTPASPSPPPATESPAWLPPATAPAAALPSTTAALPPSPTIATLPPSPPFAVLPRGATMAALPAFRPMPRPPIVVLRPPPRHVRPAPGYRRPMMGGPRWW